MLFQCNRTLFFRILSVYTNRKCRSWQDAENAQHRLQAKVANWLRVKNKDDTSKKKIAPCREKKNKKRQRKSNKQRTRCSTATNGCLFDPSIFPVCPEFYAHFIKTSSENKQTFVAFPSVTCTR